jgi:diaminopimelate epimerase
MTAFLKMHGLGNDFAVFDTRGEGASIDALAARAIADRKTGIGCDQVIVIGRLKGRGADAQMRIFNADGSEVESCGNAARCVGQLLLDESDAESVAISTLGGPLSAWRSEDGRISVDIGPPRLEWAQIPLAAPADTNHVEIEEGGRRYDICAVNVGNPHCVLFVEDAETAPVTELGPRLERHRMFPARINVEFVRVISRGRLRMRVWERGVGITRACGTGACAAAVAAHRRDLAERKVDVVLDGGVLTIEWRATDDHVIMTGPTTLVYRGEIDLASLAP